MRAKSAANTILAAALLAVSAPAMLCAQDVDARARFEAFARQSGARIEESTTAQGRVTSVEVNGVRMSRIGDGPLTHFLEQDVSGRGAVLCTWKLTAVVGMLLDSCHPGDAVEAKEDNTQALRDMLGFIVANDIARRPRSYWETEVEAQLASGRHLTPEQVDSACRREPTLQILAAYMNTPREVRRRTTAELLSVPRQPVFNPCL